MKIELNKVELDIIIESLYAQYHYIALSGDTAVGEEDKVQEVIDNIMKQVESNKVKDD